MASWLVWPWPSQHQAAHLRREPLRSQRSLPRPPSLPRLREERHGGEVGSCFGLRFAMFCGHSKRCRTPDVQNSRKIAEKGAEWVPGKVPAKQQRNSQKNSRNSQDSCFSAVSAVFPAAFWRFYQNPLGTSFGCFPAVLNVGHLAPLLQ